MARRVAPEEPADVMPPAAEPHRISINGARGELLGYSFTLKDDLPEQDEGEPRLRHLARCLAGWSSFYVDGEKYPFSHDRAVTLFQRFPFIAAQVETAIKKGSA